MPDGVAKKCSANNVVMDGVGSGSDKQSRGQYCAGSWYSTIQ